MAQCLAARELEDEVRSGLVPTPAADICLTRAKAGGNVGGRRHGGKGRFVGSMSCCNKDQQLQMG